LYVQKPPDCSGGFCVSIYLTMTRLLLADDHAILRDGIRALLSAEPDLLISGEASNGVELLDLLQTTPTDVVLMDVNMPVLDGYETMQEINKRFPDVRVLVLSMLDHENYVMRMLDAGAAGYVLKNAAITEIIHAIRTVATGQRFLCTEIGLNVLYKLTSQSTTHTSDIIPALPPGVELTSRELEVLRLIAEGLTNQEIADKLFTSKRTIETHRQNIITKTQAKNTAALIKLALGWGLIS
jgi:DNA-binding NarL/FixJ family response regulator